MSNKTIYEERADDLRILAGKEPNADTPETDKAVANEGLSPHPYIELARRLERERDEARRYIKKMDAVIDDLKCAVSCINPLEDLKRAILALKKRAEKAEAALADAAGINSPHNACQFREGCRKAEAEIREILRQAEEVKLRIGEDV